MSLDGLKYSTDFTKAFQPFFDWCLNVFIESLDERSKKGLRGMIRSRRFHTIVTVHHRRHKLWETFAHRTPHTRIFGLTRRYVGHPKRRDNVVHVMLPSYLLANPNGVARVFIHEFAHATQNHMVWYGGQMRWIPKGGAWAHDAAEEDADAAEQQFTFALADLAGVNPDTMSNDEIHARISALVEAEWNKVLAKHRRVREVVLIERINHRLEHMV